MSTSPSWSLSDAQKPTREAADQLGNKYLIGNGFVGVRGTLDEYGKDEKVACIPTGIYDQYPGKWREPINLPNPLLFRVIAHGKALSAIESSLESHRQGLDFRRGVAARETVFVAGDDPSCCIKLESERFASMAHPNLLCSKITVTATKDVTVEVVMGVDGDVWDINGPHLAPYRTQAADDTVAVFSKSLEKKIPIVSATAVRGAGSPSDALGEKQAFKRSTVAL
jgi:kojibiose phosphorylase/nigerose phosphorylase